MHFTLGINKKVTLSTTHKLTVQYYIADISGLNLGMNKLQI